MAITVQVSQLGLACIPDKYAAEVVDAIRIFPPHKDAFNQVSRYLRNGGAAVLGGDWPDIVQLAQLIASREREIIPHVKDARARKLAARNLRQRILTLADALPLSTTSPADLPGLLGEVELPDLPILLPVDEAVNLVSSVESLFRVEPLEIDLLNHPDVLTPRSQETIALMCAAIDSVAAGLPDRAEVLDMGCGSGVLSIAVAMKLRDREVSVTACDVLPEALALTRLNVRRQAQLGSISSCSVRTARPGDLFENVADRQFDLLIFNAPWVVAPAHNRAELALNDENQSTIRRFLSQSPAHLRPEGRIIVGYADNSGPKAIARLEEFIAEAGLRTREVLKDRVKTYRSRRPWQSIFAYILERND
ncbi:MAG: methyltransferase [Bacillota bacterium]|jgi:methylase of polypeptide subunit release factors